MSPWLMPLRTLWFTGIVGAMNNRSSRTPITIMVALMLAATFLRFVAMFDAPPGMRYDEMTVVVEADRIRAGDRLSVDPVSGRIENLTTGETLACERIPDHLMQMVRDGGLVPHLEKRLRVQKEAAP